MSQYNTHGSWFRIENRFVTVTVEHDITNAHTRRPAAHTRSTDAGFREDCGVMVMYHFYEKSLNSVVQLSREAVSCTMFDHTLCVYTRPRTMCDM